MRQKLNMGFRQALRLIDFGRFVPFWKEDVNGKGMDSAKLQRIKTREKNTQKKRIDSVELQNWWKVCCDHYTTVWV